LFPTALLRSWRVWTYSETYAPVRWRRPASSNAEEVGVAVLPEEAVNFLAGSRYCETDRLSTLAWSLFGVAPHGFGRVQAIVDYVHQRLMFGYRFARATRTAWEAHEERVGVCRDFAHLAVAFCRCMNIERRASAAFSWRVAVMQRTARSPRASGSRSS
jgi:transglutaminase-like putative cysteine protease